MAARFALEMTSCSSTSSFHGFSSRSQLLTVLGKRNSMPCIRASQSVPPPKENGAEKDEKVVSSASSSSVPPPSPSPSPLSSSVSQAAKSAPAAAASAASTSASKPAKKVSTNPIDVMAFSGPAPETINGRLAMVGFAAALGVEAATGRDLAEQIGSSGEAWFVVAALLVTAASLVPMLKGVSRESKSGSLMSATAEMWNGRAAMLGLVALAITEYLKQGPLI